MKKDTGKLTELSKRIEKLEEQIKRLNGRIDGLNYLIKQVIKT